MNETNPGKTKHKTLTLVSSSSRRHFGFQPSQTSVTLDNELPITQSERGISVEGCLPLVGIATDPGDRGLVFSPIPRPACLEGSILGLTSLVHFSFCDA